MREELQSVVSLGGRFLLSPIFLMSGVMKMLHWHETAQSMQAEGMSAVPFFLAAAIAFEILGGLSLLLGFETKWGALALALFLIPVTLVFHHFWTYEGQAMMNQMQHFMKNLTIAGGLLMVAAFGAGRYSLDAWLRNRKAGLATAPWHAPGVHAS